MDRRSSSSDTRSCPLCRNPLCTIPHSGYLCPKHQIQRDDYLRGMRYSDSEERERGAALAGGQESAPRNTTLRRNIRSNGSPRSEHYVQSPTRISGVRPAAQSAAYTGGLGATYLTASSLQGTSGPANNRRAAANAPPLHQWGSTWQPTRSTPPADTPSLHSTASHLGRTRINLSSIDTRSNIGLSTSSSTSSQRASRHRPAPPGR